LTIQFLLDTSIVSAGAAKEPNARILRHLRHAGATCAIAAPVWHELAYGIDRLPPSKKRSGLEDYLRTVVERSFPILAYDQTAATWHARERARLERAGKSPPFVDGQIAAIAFSHDLTLVTTNTKHFDSFAGVRLADWTR
jgi:tRNA(fMet)-specific endonuclease VapC